MKVMAGVTLNFVGPGYKSLNLWAARFQRIHGALPTVIEIKSTYVFVYEFIVKLKRLLCRLKDMFVCFQLSLTFYPFSFVSQLAK